MPLPKTFYADWEAERKISKDNAQVVESNRLLHMDSAAVATRDRVKEAYQKAGKVVPEVETWDSAAQYQRRAIHGLRDVIGVPNTDIAKGVPDAALPQLVDAVVARVDACWQRPHDIPANTSRTVAVADRTGRQTLTEVFGAGSASPFRQIYGPMLAPAQRAIAIGGVKL